MIRIVDNGVLCIASCGKAKIWQKNPQAGPTKAADVYMGPYARRCVDYARTFYPSSWCILSAKHGFLLPGDIVPEDYNVTFSDESTNPVTIDFLRRQAKEKSLVGFKKVIIIAGKSYAKMAADVFPNAEIITPLSGLGGNIAQSKILANAVATKVPLESIKSLANMQKNDNNTTGHGLNRKMKVNSVSNYAADTSTGCQWLHEQLEKLPLLKYPFDIDKLPDNGIYFFYEDGEMWGHGDAAKPRIVRVGTHKDGNFKSRISEHFLLNQSKMNFNEKTSAPHDRSIFRKNLGRALLESDNYLKVWEIDFTTTANKIKYAHLRDIEKEKEIESKITKMLQERFSFRFIVLEGQEGRMGSSGLESRLIATIANCKLCKPSPSWLGLCSPKPQIRNGKLWIVQHLNAQPLSGEDMVSISGAIDRTKQFLK